MQTAEEIGSAFVAEYKDCNNMQTQVNLITLQHNWSIIQGKKRILELGCGSGYIANFLAEKLPDSHITALDKSPELIQFAQETYQKHNLHFSVADVTQLAATQEYDLIICFFLLHFIPDKQDMFQKLLRAMQDKANVLMIVPIEDHAMLKARGEALQELIETDPIRFANCPKLNGIEKDVNSYAEMVLKYKLQLSFSMREKIFDPRMTRDDFAKFYQGIAVELRTLNLSQEEKVAHINRVVRRMPRRINGEIDFTLHYFELIAQRNIPIPTYELSRPPAQPLRESVKATTDPGSHEVNTPQMTSVAACKL